MDVRALTARRIASQKISPRHAVSVKDALGWMCAVQAQDYGMARWGLALRAAHASAAAVDAAIDRGDVLRTHILRPTWHFVGGGDIYWLLDFSARRILAGMKSRLEQLELDRATLNRSAAIMEKALAGGNSLTREELLDIVRNAGISTVSNRGSHILAWAELHQLICSGPSRRGKRTYALLPERVPEARRMSREESLAALTRRYFRSRGPATQKDFAWWSGLPLGEVREGLALVKRSLDSEGEGSARLWFNTSSRPGGGGGVHLLPAFDEYLIGYQDRSAQVQFASQKSLVSSNGMFWPTVVAGGAVIGTWKKESSGTNVAVRLNLFRGAPRPAGRLLAGAVARAVEFFGAHPATE